MHLRRYAGLLFLSLSAVACGDSSSGSGPGATGNGAGGATQTVKGTPVARADFAATYAKAFCAGIAGCCSAKSYPYDGPKCEANLTGVLGQIYPNDPALLDYDPEAAGDCIATAASVLSTCNDAPGDAPPPCEKMFTGKVPEGGPCNLSSIVCAKTAGADVSCAYDATTKSGKCENRPIGKLGDSCGASCSRSANGDTSCSSSGSSSQGPKPGKAECFSNDGLYCETSNFQCKAIAKAGEACTSNDGCPADGFCNKGTCAPALALGAKCDFSALCANGYCDNKAQTCVAKKKNAATCQSSNECESDECNYVQGATMGTCADASSGPTSAGICSGSGF